MQGFFKVDFAITGAGEPGAPLPDRVIEGQPRNRTWEIEATADGSVTTGIWEVEPGAWRVVKDSWEVCTILHGVSELSEVGQPPIRLGAGDTFIMRPGFTCIWRVLETTRKFYVIRENV